MGILLLHFVTFCFFYFADVVIDGLTLRFNRHEYGSNLSSALLFSQVDSDLNRQSEDRFHVSGFQSSGQPVIGISAQKAAGRAILIEILASILPVNQRPTIVDVVIPNRYPPVGRLGLPPFIFKFVNMIVATHVRQLLFKHVRSSTLPALKRVWIEPVLTPATGVRVEIMQAIRRVLSARQIRCSVQRFVRSPMLHVSFADRERIFYFVPACEAFGHLLTPELLSYAYRTAGRRFVNRLAATFLVLKDGEQPVSNFSIPPHRVPLPVSQSNLTPVSSTSAEFSASTSMQPPALSYVQRMLNAPVATSSGRKRPADNTASELAASGKRPAS